MAESAPLLDQSHDENNNHAIGSSQPSRSVTRKLQTTTLLLSVVALGVVIANFIVLRNAPLGQYGSWQAEDSTRGLAIWLLVSVISSIVCIAVTFPLLINVIADAVLASGVLVWAIAIVTSLPTAEWCRRFKYPHYPSPDPPEELPPLPKCEETKIIIRWLMVAGGVIGIIVGVIYIALAVIRSIAILRSKFWRSGSFTLGNGEITFQISLKIRRGDGATSVEQTLDDAGPSSGRGPLHI
ncbi:hypothetical protein JR316_0013098 [Psilocybe cubensis]|uniref:Uncharacterized protein n=2 Tax=Psilocybe cubensis TaxID=181762 RepID=A0A8H7XU19_PSICU|nr:hypothetical protein JR316_0013098 [Psilocybe cubensis]KAH9474634.1 hypothetical protein JR316_0013098 [Psilocybe cubensis]